MASPASAQPIQFLEAIDTGVKESQLYIPQAEKEEFELKVAAKLKDLVEELIRRSQSFVSPGREKEFELHLTWALADCIQDLFNDALARSEGATTIKDIWLGLRTKAESTYRRLALQSPTSPEDFRATLWWMSERGVEEDLDLLREIRTNPPYPHEDLLQLLEETEEEIAQRVDDPFYVMKKGQETYQRYRHLWDQTYQGKYIAIYNNRVIGSAEDESKLSAELIRIQKEQRRQFRAYIVKSGDSVVYVRPPKRSLSTQAQSSAGNDNPNSANNIQRTGWNIFRDHLPELLEKFKGQWVAYHGHKRVALEVTKRELYERLVREEIPLDEIIVSRVEPLGPPIDCRSVLGSRVG